MHYDVISLGPARMDVFVTLPEDEVEQVCSLDKRRCMIELGFGDKIPVKTIDLCVGGNTGNNAVGLARLGFETAMIGTMGEHWVDKHALEILKKEGVNTDKIRLIPGAFGFGVIINYQGERTILSYYPDTECDFGVKEGEMTSDWVYLTTAGKNYECFYEEALDWVKKTGAKIAFNPGSRQVKDGVEKNKLAYEMTQILFVNKEEATTLLSGITNYKLPITNIKEILKRLNEIGPKIVVVTDGQEGAYCFDGTKYWQMPIVPATVVERTGAGDAFGSGFMAAYLVGKPIPECLKWAACNSGSVLEFIGPQQGLLNKNQMTEWLARNTTIEAKEI